MSLEDFNAGLNADVVLPVDGLTIDQQRVELFAWRQRALALEAVLRQAKEALRLTREYVGVDVLPELPGWAWFDATEEIDIVLGNPTQKSTE